MQFFFRHAEEGVDHKGKHAGAVCSYIAVDKQRVIFLLGKNGKNFYNLFFVIRQHIAVPFHRNAYVGNAFSEGAVCDTAVFTVVHEAHVNFGFNAKLLQHHVFSALRDLNVYMINIAFIQAPRAEDHALFRNGSVFRLTAAKIPCIGHTVYVKISRRTGISGKRCNFAFLLSVADRPVVFCADL